MGIFDSVTSSLGSIGKALDVGNMVRGVVDGVLPKNMAFVGDIAGAGVDYYTGNYVGAAKLGLQALKDLPQATKGQQQPQGAAGNGAAGSAVKNAALEPPPPPTSKDPQSFNLNDLLAAINALTAALKGQTTPATTATAQPKPDATASAPPPATTPAAAPSTSAAASTSSAPATSTPASSTTASTAGTATTPAPSATATPAPASTTPASGSHWKRGHRARSAPSTTLSAAESIAAYKNPKGPGWNPNGKATAGADGWRGQPKTDTAQSSNGWDNTGRRDRAAAPATANHTAASTATATTQASTNQATASTPASTTGTPATASTAPAAAAPAAATATPAAAADHPAATTTAAAATSTASGKPASASSSTTTAAASSDKGQTLSSVSQLKGMSDAAFMDAVRNGRISPDVAKDPAAMMAIQERMNEITQMNNLMTAMMRAIHDMQMAVIQNIRI